MAENSNLIEDEYKRIVQTYQTQAEQLQAKAEQLQNRQALINLWHQIKSKDTSEWTSGSAFEYLVIRGFQFEKLRVTWPYQVTFPQRFGPMEQIDGVIYLEGKAFLVESKHRDQRQDVEVVAKLRLRLERRPPGTMGIVFSTSDFTFPTEIFAQFLNPLNIILWDFKDFDYAITQGKMVETLEYKLKEAIEQGLPLTHLKDAKL